MLANNGIEALRQTTNEFFRRGPTRRCHDLLVSRLSAPKSSIGCDRVGEQKAVLVDDSGCPANIFEMQLAEVDTIKQNASGRWIVKSFKEAPAVCSCPSRQVP
jgi:hypothetical protein